MTLTEAGRPSLRARAVAAFIWAFIQSWGGRTTTFLVFVVLARILPPEQLGTAAASWLVLFLITQLADLGYGDAIVQRSKLHVFDATAPFFISLAMSALLAGVVFIYADPISTLVGLPGDAIVLQVSCLIAPVTAASAFQESFYKRHLNYRTLAVRTLAANIIGGAVAIGCAMAGFGVWSLVIQTAIVSVVGAAWLWTRPLWTPALPISLASLKSLTAFGLPVLGVRVLDFLSVRAVDFTILGKIGVVEFAFYSVASRVQITLLQLLQAPLSDVSLSGLSRLEGDLEKVRGLHTSALTFLSATIAPVFLSLSVSAPALAVAVFGAQWESSGPIMQMLLLLGAFQSMQLINGPFLTATNHPTVVLMLNIYKVVAILLCLLTFPSRTLSNVLVLYLVPMLTIFPLSTLITRHFLGGRYVEVFRAVAPTIFSLTAAYSVNLFWHVDFESPILRAAAGVASFWIVYAASMLLIARSTILEVVRFTRAAMGGGKE